MRLNETANWQNKSPTQKKCRPLLKGSVCTCLGGRRRGRGGRRYKRGWNKEKELATWFPMKINRLSNNLGLPRMIIQPGQRQGGGRGRVRDRRRERERRGERQREREREIECPLCRWNVSGTVIVIYLSEMKVNSDVQPAWPSLSANHENKLSHWNRYSSGTRRGSAEGWTAELYRLLLGNSAEFN